MYCLAVLMHSHTHTHTHTHTRKPYKCIHVGDDHSDMWAENNTAYMSIHKSKQTFFFTISPSLPQNTKPRSRIYFVLWLPFKAELFPALTQIITPLWKGPEGPYWLHAIFPAWQRLLLAVTDHTLRLMRLTRPELEEGAVFAYQHLAAVFEKASENEWNDQHRWTFASDLLHACDLAAFCLFALSFFFLSCILACLSVLLSNEQWCSVCVILP